MTFEQEPQTPGISFSEQKDLPINQLNALFEAIGWNPRPEGKWKKALEASSYVVSAWDEERLVGIGRILEDGVMCMFYDIGISPAYQNRRIGKGIMERLIDRVKDEGFASIGIFAWEENPLNIPFYEKFGFEKQTSGMELVKYMARE